METMKDILNFCNLALFYERENVGIAEELNQVRKYIIKSFLKKYRIQRLLQHCL